MQVAPGEKSRLDHAWGVPEAQRGVAERAASWVEGDEGRIRILMTDVTGVSAEIPVPGSLYWGMGD
jgi:hypothetical protein